MKNELNVDDFFKSILDEELLEWEKVYRFHLSLTTNDELCGQKLNEQFLKKYQEGASENLKKLLDEKNRRNI